MGSGISPNVFGRRTGATGIFQSSRAGLGFKSISTVAEERDVQKEKHTFTIRREPSLRVWLSSTEERIVPAQEPTMEPLCLLFLAQDQKATAVVNGCFHRP